MGQSGNLPGEPQFPGANRGPQCDVSMMRVMTYNVHGCVGTDRRRNYTRIAEVIAGASPDVVALQELDAGRRRSANIHQAQALATLLEMEFHFHPALRVREEEEYGDAILSRLPMVKVKSGALPSGIFSAGSEPRGALWVSVRCGSRDWQVITTHLGLGPVERYRQALALAGEEWMGKIGEDHPLIVCGDFNSHPNSRVIRVLKNRLRDAGEFNG